MLTNELKRQESLGKAVHTKRYRKNVRERVKACGLRDGLRILAAEITGGVAPEMANMKVVEYMRWANNVSEPMARPFLAAISAGPYKRLGELSQRQLDLLVLAILDRAEGRARLVRPTDARPVGVKHVVQPTNESLNAALARLWLDHSIKDDEPMDVLMVSVPSDLAMDVKASIEDAISKYTERT